MKSLSLSPLFGLALGVVLGSVVVAIVLLTRVLRTLSQQLGADPAQQSGPPALRLWRQSRGRAPRRGQPCGDAGAGLWLVRADGRDRRADAGEHRARGRAERPLRART